jgi:hypothetical protein
VTALAPEILPAQVPDGTEWPGPDTLVLLRRALRPGTDAAGFSRFSDDRWSLDHAVFEDHAKARSLNFALVPQALRLEAKHYVWQLLNHEKPRAMPRAAATRPAVSTILASFPHFKAFATWLSGRGVTPFGQVTLELLDGYLRDLADEGPDLEQAYRRLAEVRRLWAYRAVLPPGMRLPASPPWGGEDSRDLLGRIRSDAENRTRRIGERTMQLLLLWAIRFTEDFAGDILVAHTEYLDLHGKNPENRRRPGTSPAAAHRPGELAAKVTAYLQDLRDRGEPLPGKRDESGTRAIDWRHLSRIMGCNSMERTSTGRMIWESGLPVSDGTPLDAPVTARIDGQPWLAGRIAYHQAPGLARLLSTACFVVIAYLSGARAGEVLNLRRGCVEPDDVNDLWLMRGLHYKGVKDKDGSKLPEGEIRRDPWVVIQIVARAISVLERLHPHQLLFPTRIEPYHLLSGRIHKRSGNARTDGSITDDLAAFTAWVNGNCRRLGRADAIPDDEHGSLHSSRFRRTLAWFIRRRPRGLVAASIQYGHLHTRLLQGYAGSYESGFPDDYAFEDWLFRLEKLAEDQQALQSGEHVSGPAAETYRQRVAAAGAEFAGLVLTSPQQARDLLGNPLLQVHHGDGMTCVFNPATAACQFRGNRDDPQVTPDEDDCRPRCPNLARTDRDAIVIWRRVSELEAIVADPLSPPIRHAREQHELGRLRAVLDTHAHGKEPAAS